MAACPANCANGFIIVKNRDGSESWTQCARCQGSGTIEEPPSPEPSHN